MNFNDYQQEAKETCGTTFHEETLLMSALGLAGEAGECCDLIKKRIFHGHDLDKQFMKKELGDVLWYLAILADAYSFTLEEVAQANIEKLRKRYPDGFDAERSKNRKEE